MSISTNITLPAVHPFTGMDVASALERRAERNGSDRFLVWEHGNGEPVTWTYREFGDEVDRVAAGLVERGVVAGDAVMLLLENSPAFLFCWFACARLGAVAIDTNARYVADELAHGLRLTGAVGAVTHEHLVPRLEESGVPLGWVVTVDEPQWTISAVHGNPATLPERAADPGAPLCVQFTSGTTSRPKAVLYTHANALWGGKVGADHGRFTRDDVTLVHGPLFHTQALSWLFLSTFWVGGTVVLMPKFSVTRFWDVSLRHGCTVTSVIGLMFATVLREAIPEHHYRVWSFGMERPELEAHVRVRLFNAWGMTEVVTQPIVGNLDHRVDTGAIGHAASEYRLRVVREDGTDCAAGEAGDLLVGGVRGLSVFAEYLNDPEATAESFDDAGYFRTGDRVLTLPSGALHFQSRAKDMLKVGGENVAAGEIERVLMGVPGVAAAAVVGRPDPFRDEVPIGFVTVVPGTDAGSVPDAAIALCQAQLADFKVPGAVYVVDELPEALLGKISKVTLRDWALARQAEEGAQP